MASRIPSDSGQVLVVKGDDPRTDRAEAVLYTRVHGMWSAGSGWQAHNGARGWTRHHHQGDLRSPEGVFTLTAAGGRLPAPRGTHLPYDHSPQFRASGAGINGEPLRGAFDYVVGIDYNRVSGSTPLDERRPRGTEAGGGIWLHVDHHGGTEACVTLSRAHMVELLRSLDPALHPVVVMAAGPDLGRA